MEHLKYGNKKIKTYYLRQSIVEMVYNASVTVQGI